LNHVVTLFEQEVAPELATALKPLAELTRVSVGRKLKLGQVLAMPINLRNRMVHDSPTDPQWWGVLPRR